MFVLSVKAKKKWGILAAAAVVVLLLLVVHSKKENTQGIPGETNSQRTEFLAQYGWEIGEGPVEVRDVRLPQEFNDVYTEYNEVQKSQGMDLLPYAGEICQQWIYPIANYPEQGTIRATILVYKGQIIGGDISSAELNGFLCGFAGQKAGEASMPEIKAESLPESTEEKDAEPQAEPETKEQEPLESADAQVIPEDAWPTD